MYANCRKSMAGIRSLASTKNAEGSWYRILIAARKRRSELGRVFLWRAHIYRRLQDIAVTHHVLWSGTVVWNDIRRYPDLPPDSKEKPFHSPHKRATLLAVGGLFVASFRTNLPNERRCAPCWLATFFLRCLCPRGSPRGFMSPGSVMRPWVSFFGQ
jgi:hypothetical protein